MQIIISHTILLLFVVGIFFSSAMNLYKSDIKTDISKMPFEVSSTEKKSDTKESSENKKNYDSLEDFVSNSFSLDLSMLNLYFILQSKNSFVLSEFIKISSPPPKI